MRYARTPAAIADDVDRVSLEQPAMQLRKKFAALRLGHLRLRRAIAQRTKRGKGGKQEWRGLRIAGCGLFSIEVDCVLVERLDDFSSCS